MEQQSGERRTASPPAGDAPSLGRRVVRALTSLREIEAELEDKGDAARVCQLVARAIGELTLADVVIVSAAAAEGKPVLPVASHTSAARPINPRLVNSELAAAQVNALAPGAMLHLDVWGSDDEETARERADLAALGVHHALVLPLVRGRQRYGRIDLLAAQTTPPSPIELDVCVQLAGQAATALALAWAEASSADAEGAELMLWLSEALRQAQLDHPSELLQAVVALLPRVIDCDHAYAYLWNAQRHEFLPAAVTGMSEEQVAVLKQHPMNPQVVPLFERLLYTTRPATIDDVQEGTLLPAELTRQIGAHALLALPIRGRRQDVLGALLLDYTTPERRFAPAQVALAGRVVEQVAAMVENASLYEQASRRSDQLAVLNEIGIDLASISDLPALFPLLHDKLASVIDTTALMCALVNQDGPGLTIYHMSETTLSIRHCADLATSTLLSQAFEERQGIIRQTGGAALVDELLGAERPVTAESVVCVPMRVHGQKVIGALAAYSTFEHAYSNDDRELLSTVASQLAVAVENATLYAQVQAKGELRGHLLDRIMSAHELERKSIVDDIHDDTLQSMVSSMYKIDLCLRLSETENHQRELEELRNLRASLAGNIDRLRSLIFEIRPSTLDFLGLLPTLDNYLGRMEKETGIRSTFRSEIGTRLEIGLETLIYRLVQELLSNVRRHSKASVVNVELQRVEGGIQVDVRDDGIGFVPETVLNDELPGEGIGLAYVRERVQVAGGHFTLESQPGSGTHVRILLPMNAGRHITGPLDEGRVLREAARL